LKRRIHELEAMVANLNKTPASRKKKIKRKPAGR